MRVNLVKRIISVLVLVFFNVALGKDKPIKSITTGYTIVKVKTAVFNKKSNIIASTYDGRLLAINYDGKILWENELSGFMNHDIWIDDINGDGNEEVIAANADGSVYCVNYKGELLWSFKQNDAPMISACVIHSKDKGEPYIACGGNDLNIYYVSNQGELLKTISSSSYKTLYRPNKKWQDDGTLPYNVHTVNFLRPLPQSDGSDVLLLDAILSHADRLNMYFYFYPEQEIPFKSYKVYHGPVGDMNIVENPENKQLEILLGTSGITEKHDLGILNPENKQIQKINFAKNTGKRSLGFGYRVSQTEVIETKDSYNYLTKKGEYLFITNPTDGFKDIETLKGTYSYHDIHKDEIRKKIILGSVQSGGNQIHIIDYTNNKWKSAFENLEPSGNIENILLGTKETIKNLRKYKKADWERDPKKITLMSPPSKWKMTPRMEGIKNKYDNLSFLGYAFLKDVGAWDRSYIKVNSLRTIKDGRKKYVASPESVQEQLISKYNENGLCTWGGHGVDPYYYGYETIKKVIDAGNGKQSVWVWPELTILHKKDFKYVLDDLLYPLSKYSKGHNAKQFIRSKHIFWQSYIYKPEWSRFLSGEFADVLVPSMEETQDFSMELSLASRLGLWSSGVANSWGTRCARDNPSFMRSRQFSHQNLPNHFLRNAIYHVSYGADYINNFNVDSKYSDYMSLLWELIGKGALYAPKPKEILSFSPVHISMTKPDETYSRVGNGSTTTLRFDKEYEDKNPFVFGRLSSDWTGGKNTPWDFSNYAAGAKDKRLNFLAPYPNGMVLITPVQNGVLKQKNAVRKPLKENLHPIYKNILSEYITDGKDYISEDGKQRMKADVHYKEVVRKIKESAKLLPISVTGDVAWVVAQTSPKHLRLTLIDNGYLNPKDRIAKIKFNTVTPVKVVDVLDGKTFKYNAKNKGTEIDVPCGMFRFIDVELDKEL